MKHAGAETIRQLEPLLVKLRQFAELKEPKPGTFYRRSKAFLHFHEDPEGIFADVKLTNEDFTRMRTSTAAEQSLQRSREL